MIYLAKIKTVLARLRLVRVLLLFVNHPAFLCLKIIPDCPNSIIIHERLLANYYVIIINYLVNTCINYLLNLKFNWITVFHDGTKLQNLRSSKNI